MVSFYEDEFPTQEIIDSNLLIHIHVKIMGNTIKEALLMMLIDSILNI